MTKQSLPHLPSSWITTKNPPTRSTNSMCRRWILSELNLKRTPRLSLLYRFHLTVLSSLAFPPTSPSIFCRFATACVAGKVRVRRGKIDRLIGGKGDKSRRMDNECVDFSERLNHE